MKKKDMPDTPERSIDNQNNPEPEGYPLYPPSEDIYSQFEKESEIDPEDPTRAKSNLDEIELLEEIDPEIPVDELVENDLLYTDLDVPGSDLDDELEEVGSEDEENNYYSIGGDNHHDLEDNDGIEDLDI